MAQLKLLKRRNFAGHWCDVCWAPGDSWAAVIVGDPIGRLVTAGPLRGWVRLCDGCAGVSVEDARRIAAAHWARADAEAAAAWAAIRRAYWERYGLTEEPQYLSR